MKRVLVALLGLIALILVVRAVASLFLSQEDRVRARIEQMASGFDDTDLSDCMIGFAPDFHLRNGDFGRETIKSGLVALFFEAKDPTTKRFPYRVEVPSELATIEVQGAEEDRAQASLTARFYEREGDDERLVWEVRIDGGLVRGQEGWQFKEAEYETVLGARLGR